VGDDGDLDPAADRPAASWHDKIGVLGGTGGDSDRPAQVDAAHGELPEPLGPCRPVLADRQVLAQEGRGHRLGLVLRRSFGRQRRR
jgi:hypothetical protein